MNWKEAARWVITHMPTLSRMERTRHQLAPAMPSEKSAGAVADRLLVGPLEIVGVQHLTGAGGFGKARQQRFLLRYRPVLALASAARLRPERFEPAPGVKDGRHSDGTACRSASRPILDRREHGGTLDPFGLARNPHSNGGICYSARAHEFGSKMRNVGLKIYCTVLGALLYGLAPMLAQPTEAPLIINLVATVLWTK